MSYVRMLIGMFFMAALLVFGLENVQERVNLDLRPIALFRGISLSLVLFYSYFAGLVTFALIAAFRDLALRRDLARVRRENRRLLDELHAHRSASLDDLPIEDEEAVGSP